MKFDIVIMLKKGVLGFLTGLTAVVIMAVVKALTDYKPVVCTQEVLTNCTPQYVMTLYAAIVPVVTGSLVAFANWLKNRSIV